MASIYVGLEMACLLVLGVLAKKLKLVGQNFAGELSRVVLNFSLPCVIIKALMKPVTEEQTRGIPTVLLCVCVYLLAAMIVTKIFVRKHDEFSTVMTVSNLFTNFTFMGYPVIEAFYGSEGVLWLSVISIPVRVILYIMLPLQFSKTHKAFGFKSFKGLLVPAVIAIPVGVLLQAASITLPTWLSDVVTSVGGTSTPLGMMVCGLIVADMNIGTMFKDRHALVAAFIRLMLLPALTLAGIYFLPISNVVRNVMVIFAALPTATIITAYAASFDNNPKQAAMIVTVSTLVSIVTLPMWAWILTLV